MRARSKRSSDSPLPWVAAAGGLLVVGGWLVTDVPDPQVSAAGPWLITAGVLSLATATAVAWSATGGGMIAGGLWLLAAGWLVHGLPDGTQYRSYWPLLLLVGLALACAGVPGMWHDRGGSRGVV